MLSAAETSRSHRCNEAIELLRLRSAGRSDMNAAKFNKKQRAPENFFRGPLLLMADYAP